MKIIIYIQYLNSKYRGFDRVISVPPQISTKIMVRQLKKPARCSFRTTPLTRRNPRQTWCHDFLFV